MSTATPRLTVRAAPVPDAALLRHHTGSGDYTDCYAIDVASPCSLADFMRGFYTSPAFRPERWLLATLGRLPSADGDLQALLCGDKARFAAWTVLARDDRQALLAAGRTRSWFMVLPPTVPASPPASSAHAAVTQTAGARPGQAATAGGPPTGTTLLFGSAVMARRRGGLGWAFHALVGFHRLYSRALLASAARTVMRRARG